MSQDSISVFFKNENDDYKNCKAFLTQFVQISNSRLELLYRFYSTNSELQVSENPCEAKHSVKVQASGQQEIRYLLASLLGNVEHKFSSVVHRQKLKDHSLLFTNGVLEAKNTGARYFFTRTWMLKGETNGLTISSETVQIYSHNSKESLLTLAKLKLEHFRKNSATHFPQVIEKRIRVKVGVCSLLTETCSVGIRPQSSCQKLFPTSEQLVHSNAAMEFCEDEMRPSCGALTPEGRSTRIWSSTPLRTLTDLPKSVSPLTLNCEYPFVAKKTPKLKEREMRLHTPLEEHSKFKSVETEDPLSPFKRLPDHSNQDTEDTSPPVDTRTSFLSIFAPPPEPKGAPVVWDLSHEAVPTQMRLTQEARGERSKLEGSGDVVLSPLSADSNTVPWNERTLFLDNLPRDVHPDSLRRAFEVTFGEIEEENGIILCSARRSSIAYIVFKSKLSAEAVGRSDCWIKGSKLIIQKCKDSLSLGRQVQSSRCPLRNDQFQGSSSSRSSLSSTTSDAFSTN